MVNTVRTFPFKDLSNTKVGIVTVLNFSRYKIDSKDRRKAMWNVQCECGQQKEMIITKQTNSCGCLLTKFQKERLPQITAKRNENIEADLNGILNNYLQRAHKKNIEFTLNKIEFERLINTNCHYCNLEPSNQITRRSRFNIYTPYLYNGIDRVDNNQGYSLSNCVSCCKTCNYAKRNMSTDEFYKWIDRIAKWRIIQQSEVI